MDGYLGYVEPDYSKPVDLKLYKLKLTPEQAVKLQAYFEENRTLGLDYSVKSLDGLKTILLDNLRMLLRYGKLKPNDRTNIAEWIIYIEANHLHGIIADKIPDNIQQIVDEALTVKGDDVEELLPSVCTNPVRKPYYLVRPIYDTQTNLFRGYDVHKVKMCSCVSLTCHMALGDEGYAVIDGKCKQTAVKSMLKASHECAADAIKHSPPDYPRFVAMCKLLSSSYDLDKAVTPVPQSLRDKCKEQHDKPLANFREIIEELLSV